MEPTEPTPVRDPPDRSPTDEEASAPSVDKATRLRSERAEIAEEPGNHGVLAMGCGAAVALALIAFFVVRLLVMR